MKRSTIYGGTDHRDPEGARSGDQGDRALPEVRYCGVDVLHQASGVPGDDGL